MRSLGSIPVSAALAAAWCLSESATADVRLPAIFSDHMVMQRDAEVPVWGWADPGEAVQVSVAGKTATTKADASGKWRVTLDRPAATEPVSMTVTGANTITVNDVLIGEVWLAAGQSNMQMTVGESNNSQQEISAGNFPRIRMFTVEQETAAEPNDDCRGKWIVCSPETVARFSATAYFFGRDLHQTLGAPIGLINSSWGGTPIEAWTSMEAQEGKPELAFLFAGWQLKTKRPFNAKQAQARYEKQMATLKTRIEKAKAAGKRPPQPPKKPLAPRLVPHHPANLFNAMIAPLIPYAIRGAIWYQGENNAKDDGPGIYASQLAMLVNDWRARWNQGDYPFAWVQLPNFKKRNADAGAASNWALMREIFLKSLSIPNTGMAITIDAGNEKNIHPKDKQTVGKRLALWARARVYGENIPYSGPLPAGHQIKGPEVTLSFSHADGGLKAKDGELKGFAVAGQDQTWFPATARIDGEQVIVSSPQVKSPVAVRYAWGDNPECNLINGAGLPASPFRTDSW